MIVAHYIWRAAIGGLEGLTIDLANEQLRSGITPHILVGKNEGEWSYRLQPFTHDYCNISNGYFAPLKSLRVMHRFFKNVDIIHLHTFNPSVYLMAGLSGKHIVYHVHSNWMAGKGVSNAIKIKLLNFFINKYTHSLVFNSEYTQHKFCSLFKIKTNVQQALVLNAMNSVPLVQNTASKDVFIVGSCARLAPGKRMDRVIVAFALFAKNKTNVQLNIVGGGPMEQSLKVLATKIGIAPLVNFVGSVPNATNEIAQFTVAVLGSENEPFGLVALECLNQNKTTLVFKDSGGLLEIINKIDTKNIARNEEDMGCLLEVLYLHWQNNNLHFEFDDALKNYFSIHRFSTDITSVYNSLV
jgi:glycosyltransferase involved in cell wall biosynthesis